MGLDPTVQAYYARGEEVERLAGGSPAGPLELARTRELIGRHLPHGPLDILDVGGGPGVHARWLADMGHRVHLVDPMPLHVEQAAAAAPGITAELGDARSLTNQDESVDVVLMLGPLYHLTSREDRLRALAEAHRVLRPDGWLFAAAISRYAALLDLLVTKDRLHDAAVRRVVLDGIRTGTFRGAEADLGFATAYCHLPSELVAEVEAASYSDVRAFAVEGVGYLVDESQERWADPAGRAALMSAARVIEEEPEMMAASSHLLAVARRADAL